MKKITFAILLLPWLVTSCAQSRCAIKKGYAYYTVTAPGIQMMDDNGNPIPPKLDIGRFIYLEGNESVTPEIDSVFYNNIPLKAIINPVDGNTAVVGNKFENNQQFTITVKKGNLLWRIDLYPPADSDSLNLDCKNILLKLKFKGKTCEFRIQEELQLMTLPRY